MVQCAVKKVKNSLQNTERHGIIEISVITLKIHKKEEEYYGKQHSGTRTV